MPRSATPRRSEKWTKPGDMRLGLLGGGRSWPNSGGRGRRRGRFRGGGRGQLGSRGGRGGRGLGDHPLLRGRLLLDLRDGRGGLRLLRGRLLRGRLLGRHLL